VVARWVERAIYLAAALQSKDCELIGDDADALADKFPTQLNSAQIRGFLCRFPQRRCARA
jgi:hypothetical protein